MIQFANEHTAPLVRQMWKICFGDSDEFINLYFAHKYKNENTLIYFEGDKAVASLQMLPYTINFYEQEIPFAYLAGLCTLPEYRKKGYMAQLIDKSHQLIAERNIPLSILIPAEDWLFGFYEKYGYEQVFEKDDNPLPLKEILDIYQDEKEAYNAFDLLFRPLDFCVQKSFEDFVAIREEYEQDGCPVKNNLSGMVHIIDIWTLLDLYSKGNMNRKFSIKVNEALSGKSFVYSIDNGNVEMVKNAGVKPDIEVDLRLLCRLLFGYKLNGVDPAYQLYFEENHPVMNLMLE